MKQVSTIRKSAKLATGLVVAAAAVFLTHVAMADDCPWSSFINCPATNGTNSIGCWVNGGQVGTISCTTDTSKTPPRLALLTATSTVDVDGQATCDGNVVRWTVAHSPDPNPQPPFPSAGRFCVTAFTNVACRGANIPDHCGP